MKNRFKSKTNAPSRFRKALIYYQLKLNINTRNRNFIENSKLQSIEYFNTFDVMMNYILDKYRILQNILKQINNLTHIWTIKLKVSYCNA